MGEGHLNLFIPSKWQISRFEVDLSRDIAKKLGLKVKFEPTKWDSLIAGVEVASLTPPSNNITVTPERQKTYRSQRLISIRYVLVTRKGDNSIKGINDKGKRLVEGTGSDNAAIAKKYGATVVPNGDFPTTLQISNKNVVKPPLTHWVHG